MHAAVHAVHQVHHITECSIMWSFLSQSVFILLALVSLWGGWCCGTTKTDVQSFLAQHPLCSDAKVNGLVGFTKRASCEDFLTNEVIVAPLSQGRYTQTQYNQLAANLIAAVKRGVLRIGLSGGSITNMWSRPFKLMAEKVFRGLGDNFNGHESSPGTLVQVMDGAIGATGALIPAGCPTNLLGDANLDVIIVEFAANDHDEQHLRSLVRVLQKTYRNAALVIMELTTLKARDPHHKPWLAAGTITKEFNLPFVNWSTVVDIGFNKTFDPYDIWTHFDTVHPKPVGANWIALSVLETLEAVYRHNVAAVAQGSRALQSLPLPDHKARADVSSQVCVTDYCSGDCWKLQRHKHGSGEECYRNARQFNASRCHTEGASRVMKFDVVVTVPCQLAVALVGNGYLKFPVQCNMDVLDNNKPHGAVHTRHLFMLSQTVLPLSTLQPGAHVISLVPNASEALKGGHATKAAGADQEEVCNVSGLMCIPL